MGHRHIGCLVTPTDAVVAAVKADYWGAASDKSLVTLKQFKRRVRRLNLIEQQLEARYQCYVLVWRKIHQGIDPDAS
jgi:hypothetical protein